MRFHTSPVTSMIDNAENSENELVRLCQQRDGHAFERLIGRYRKPLFTFFLRFYGDKELAEDLFQDTLVKVWRFLPGYQQKSAFASWLFSIAHNVARDALRRQKARSHVTYNDRLPDKLTTQSPDDELVAAEMQTLIEQAVQHLPPRQRQVFLLRQHGGLAFKEIAEVTGEPLNTVLSHMRYAVAKLKKKLRETGMNV